jgi:hypothetical protein
VIDLKHLRVSAVFLLSLCCGTTAIARSSTFTIAGVVHDSGGAHIANAHVVAVSDGASVEAVTDGQGEFHLTAPSAGRYEVTVTADGFRRLTAFAELSQESPSAHLDLTLEAVEHSEKVKATADTLPAETTGGEPALIARRLWNAFNSSVDYNLGCPSILFALFANRVG